MTIFTKGYARVIVLTKHDARMKTKGFKISNASRTKIIGVAGTSLDEVLRKSCLKFSEDKDESSLLLQDGTVVDSEEYFETLQPQTIMILAKNDEPFFTGTEIIYNALAALNKDVLAAGTLVRQFFTENLKEKVRVLSKLVSEDVEDDRTMKSTPQEDPEWFEGLETNCRRKELFMGRKAQDRVKGYFYKTKDDLRKSNGYRTNKTTRAILDQVLEEMKRMLKVADHMAGYFDRCDELRMCDSRGEFSCSGSWKRIKCDHRGHSINPYSTREQRIIFSTWNLDHRIERARSVVPALVGSAERVSSDSRTDSVNSEYFFELLFTSENLRLVHVVCHDKSAHSSAKPDVSRTVVRPKLGLSPVLSE